MQLICLVNKRGLFPIKRGFVPIKDKKRNSIVNVFKKISQNANQIKYGLVNVVNFAIILSKIF